MSSRYLIANILISISLIIRIPILKNNFSSIFNGFDIIWGITVIAAIFIGFYASIVKSKYISQNSDKKLSRPEGIFIGALFLFGMLGYLLMVFSGFSLIFGDYDKIPGFFQGIMIFLYILIFVFIFIEGHFAFNKSKKVVSKSKNRTADILLLFYISTGIGVTWDSLILGSNIKPTDIISDLFFGSILVLMILLPFQRLFWMEIMMESKGIKDNIKVIGSLLITVLSAIIPIYFV